MSHNLESAKSAFRAAAKLLYPPGLTVSQWWAERQAMSYNAIEMFQTVEAAIGKAQGKASFDHREYDPRQLTQTINFKLAELKLRFPEFDLKYLPEESSHSAPESILTVDGRKVSSIFLTHLYFCLRTMKFLKPKATHYRIAEIGSGYGALARVYKEMYPDTLYVLIDLPESLFSAQVFIEANYPDAKMFYVQDALPESLDDYDFVFVPAQSAPLLKGQSFDLTLNTGSLQEMTVEAVLFWMHFVQYTIDTKLFYSWNYFLNDKDEYPEAAGSSLICPIIDPFWNPIYFRINDPVITVDCNQRNWLEVLLERVPREQHEAFDRFKYAVQLIENANSSRPWTNAWFQNIWMSLWVNQEPHIIEALIEGINKFAKGQSFGIQNHLPVTTEFSETRFYSKVKVQAERAIQSSASDDPAPVALG